MIHAFLTRRVRFSAAHRYWRPDWSERRNREVFGACSNPHGHGHGYRLEVTVRAPVNESTGFSVDLAGLDAILRDEVMVPLDHQHLNHAVPDFAEGGLIPTCENLLLWLRPRIEHRLVQPATLYRLRLYEDEDLFVDVYGSDGP